MPIKFPLKFTLEDGVEVTITKNGENNYDFNLQSEDGTERRFLYTDGKPRNEWIESLEFDQLNAVRKFWLEQEDMDLD